MWVWVFALFCLIACWWVGDFSTATKVKFTLLYLASWGLLFIRGHEYLFTVAQCLLVIIIGGATFGIDWLMKRR